MSSPAMALKDLLVAAGVGTFAATTGWSIHVGREPAQSSNVPHTTVTVYDTPGKSPNPQWLLDEPTCQVRVRGTPNGYSAGWNKALEVKNALLGLPSQDIGTDRWVSIAMMGDIQSIGFTEQEQPLFTLNFKMIIEPATGTNRSSL